VLVKTRREGLAARAGHDLTMEITQWSAQVTVPAAEEGGIAAATLTAELDLGSLAVREGTGGAKPLSDRDPAGTSRATARKILGDAAKASFASSRVVPAPAGLAVPPTARSRGTLTLRGTSRPLRLQVISPRPRRVPGERHGTADGLSAITPYSGFFGTLKLKDEGHRRI